MVEITGEDLQKIRENGIFLMVPAYAGQCFAAFARSLMGLSSICTQYGIPLDTFFIYNESLITRARNYCADAFLRRKFKYVHADGTVEERHFQHGIFIDTDIEFNPADVIVMAYLQNKHPEYDILCGPYPKKMINYEKLKMAVDKGLADEDANKLDNYIGDFVFNTISSDPVSLNEPFEVLESGTGFMMFRRDTLLKIAEDNPDMRYRPDHINTENFDGSREIYAFFDTAIDPTTKRYLSEDYYFCQKARASNMKVWLVPWFQLKHNGFFIYNGSLGEMAMAGLPAGSIPRTKGKG